MLHLLIEVAGVALINAVAPSLAIVAAAWACMYVRGWSAATRYAIWWLTLGMVIVLPFLPPSKKPGGVAPVQFQIRHSPAAQPDAIMPVRQQASRQQMSPADLIGFVCCGLVAVQLSRLLYAFVGVLRLKRSVYKAVPAAGGMRRRILLATSDVVSSPVAVGYWLPMVILPAKLALQLRADESEHVIAHEMAHLERYDDWAIALQRVLAAVFAFHPLVQFICWRMNLDREMACDDRVLACAKPAQYAASLTKVAECIRFGDSVALTLPLLTLKSNLARRIETMLDRKRSHAPRLSPSRWFAFAVVSLLIAAAGLRAPALLASPLSDQAKDEMGPIVLTLPDGVATTFGSDGTESQKESAFPHGSIVFKKQGKSFIIRDRATIDQSAKLMQPLEDLSRQQRELGEKQRALGEQQELLGNRMEGLADSKLDAATQKLIEEKVREAQKALQSLDLKKLTQSAERAQEELSEMQSKLGDLQARIGEELARAGEAQGKLGGEQGALGEQQGHLGELQGRLGEQQAEAAKRIRKEMKQLIDRAEKQGLARPIE